MMKSSYLRFSIPSFAYFTLLSCVCIIADIRCTIPDFFSCPCLSDATWPPFGYLSIVDDNREEMFVKRKICLNARITLTGVWLYWKEEY